MFAEVASAAPTPLPAESGTLDPALESALTETRGRKRGHLVGRDLLSSLVIGLGFLVAAGLAFAYLPQHRPTVPWLVALLVLVYAAASRVEFAVGSGYAIPTALVLVPMLFVVPLREVPLCVAAGLLLRDVPEIVRGHFKVDRGLLRLVSSWHAFGPVLVLALAGDHSPSTTHVPLYVAALGAQFLLDFGSCALRERLGLGISPRKLLGFIKWAWFVDLALAPVGLAIAMAARQEHAAVLLAIPLVGLLRFFAREREQGLDHALELSQAYRGTALLLGDVVEADDAYTGSHSRDVVDLVLGVCDELGLSARDRRDAEFVALLHDVGKIRIPSEIINKPGPLDPEERAIINTHTIIGEQLLSQVGGLLGQIGRLVRSCHERWDGGGYPDGLAGEEIPQIARIVCACDAYSAITTTRSYRAARSPEEALAELRRNAGTQFDPRVVEALGRVLTT
jgi:HD-GYP domain-containing protein (c-di-GMP phosphodiesterase class II)